MPTDWKRVACLFSIYGPEPYKFKIAFISSGRPIPTVKTTVAATGIVLKLTESAYLAFSGYVM